MTQPTPAQIEAALKVYRAHYHQTAAGRYKAMQAALIAAAQVGEQDLQTFNKVLEKTLAENNDQLRAALVRSKTILANMAQENEGAIFNRWPISHEPLRADAKGVLPQIEAALVAAQVGEPPEIKMMPWFGDEINATIERCAQVAEQNISEAVSGCSCSYNIAAAIRELKDAP